MHNCINVGTFVTRYDHARIDLISVVFLTIRKGTLLAILILAEHDAGHASYDNK